MNSLLVLTFFVYVTGIPFALFTNESMVTTRARWAQALAWPLFTVRALVRGFREAWRQ